MKKHALRAAHIPPRQNRPYREREERKRFFFFEEEETRPYHELFSSVH